MLDFILGAAKSGKTTTVFNLIKQLCKEDGEGIFYFVPEQFALEAEISLFEFLGSELFKRVTVTSFSRISQEIFKACGGLAGSYVNEASKLLIMSRAIEQVKEDFSVYKKSARYTSFAKTMLDTIEEFKNAGVASELLMQKQREATDGSLKDKLFELSQLYSVYDALLSDSFLDKSDDIERACRLLGDNCFFKGTCIFIDEFKGFTGIELKMLKYMLIQAGRVCVTLCHDKKRAEAYKSSPFASTDKTYASLVKTARQVSCRISPPTRLEDSYFVAEELAALEKGIYSPRVKAFEEKNSAVSVTICKNEYDEVDFVASMIKQLVKENGLKYSDIAIVARDMAVYSPILKAAALKYELEIYDDSVDNAAHKPLIRFVAAALSCVAFGMTAENVLNLLKCGITGFSVAEVSELENYIYVWSISPKHWGEEFVASPQGFRSELSQEDKNVLVRINKIRSFVYKAISGFKAKAEDADVQSICEAVVELLDSLCARETMQRLIEGFLAEEDYEQAQDCKRTWDVLMELLNSFCVSLKTMPISTKRFLELFILTAKTYDTETLPQSVDCILVGDALRIRAGQKKAVFILGANEDAFPLLPVQKGVFTDKDKVQLLELELEISPPLLERINEERFIAYKTLTLPTELLFITAKKSDTGGVPCLISPVINQLVQLFGEGAVRQSEDFSQEFYCQTKKSAFSRLAQNAYDENGFFATLKSALLKDEVYARRIKRLDLIKQDKPFELKEKDVATTLFCENMYISPTRVETFYRCAFRYFCEHGLRILPLQKAELNPLETGNLIHLVLERVVSKINFKKPLNEKEIGFLIEDVMDSYIANEMGGEETKSKRFIYLYKRVKQSILELVKRLYDELSKSDFTPCAFELEISEHSEVAPLELVSPNGRRVHVFGKIDRVDCYTAKDGKKYIRIVDYKSGKKEFRLDEVLYGLNLQMLIYLHCIEKNGSGFYESTLPAGILYMPSGEKRGALDRAANQYDITVARNKAYRMNGLLLSEPEIIDAMESPCEGIYIPVSQKRDGSFSTSSAASLISLQSLGKINKYIERLITEMADELFDGKIDAVSFDKSCDFCNYSYVCAKKENGKKREYIKLDKNEDIVKAMENGIETVLSDKANEGVKEDGN